MKIHPDRKLTHLPDYEYAMPQGYFITACTINRNILFESTEAILAIESAWCSILDIFANIELDEFVVMPNHIHGIVWITGEVSYSPHLGAWKKDSPCRDGQQPPSTEMAKFEIISSLVNAFKTTATVQINQLERFSEIQVWEKGFYSHIHNDRELERIQEYIRNNPNKWVEDRDNPAGPKYRPLAKSIDDYWNEIFNSHR